MGIVLDERLCVFLFTLVLLGLLLANGTPSPSPPALSIMCPTRLAASCASCERGERNGSFPLNDRFWLKLRLLLVLLQLVLKLWSGVTVRDRRVRILNCPAVLMERRTLAAVGERLVVTAALGDRLCLRSNFVILHTAASRSKPTVVW